MHDELAAYRDSLGHDLSRGATPENFAAQYAACWNLVALHEQKCEDYRVDILVVIGDDHKEWCNNGLSPTFIVFNGASLTNRALSDDEKRNGIPPHNTPIRHASQLMNRPESDENYPVCPALAAHILNELIVEEFDVAACDRQPLRPDGLLEHLPYAFSFVQRCTLKAHRIPMVPIMVNSYFPPIQPTPSRCFQFGAAIGRAIQSWSAYGRVGVYAAGGMSHFTLDEDLDQEVIRACEQNDFDALCSIPERLLQGGNSELKEWITVAGVMSQTRLRFRLNGYVPIARSAAGIGQGMGYATWE